MGAAREAVYRSRGTNANAGARTYGRRKSVGWRGKPYSVVEGVHDPRTNRNTASPKRRFKVAKPKQYKKGALRPLCESPCNCRLDVGMPDGLALLGEADHLVGLLLAGVGLDQTALLEIR